MLQQKICYGNALMFPSVTSRKTLELFRNTSIAVGKILNKYTDRFIEWLLIATSQQSPTFFTDINKIKTAYKSPISFKTSHHQRFQGKLSVFQLRIL